MSKIKIRCSQCGKSFKSTNPKQLICPECEEKARRERAARTKGIQPPASTPTPAPRQAPLSRPVAPPPTPPAPKPHWLDTQPDIKIAALEPSAPARPPRLDLPERQAHPSHLPAAKAARLADKKEEVRPSQGGLGVSSLGQGAQKVGRKPEYSKKAEGEKTPKGSRPAGVTAKPKREPRRPTPPFAPTPEQINAIELRYLELAQPHEFDGIRTQIAKELNMPKSAVKKVVGALRERQEIPSWWDLQTYHGSPEDLEHIRSAYVPFLPLPPLGIHKQIAALLNLPAGIAYQAIKVIRAEMDLPQYNSPEGERLSALSATDDNRAEDRPLSS